MTIWSRLSVPYAESDIARAAGAEWSRLSRTWWCNASQWRSRAFKRWHSRATWRRVTIHVADGPLERAAAKERRCLFCPQTKTWYVEVTDDATISSNAWLRRRTHPPEVIKLRVPYEDRELAKACGARWLPVEKCWAYCAHQAAVLPAFVQERRIKQTTV